MTEQLKPCPFCGGLAKAYERTCDKSDRYDPSHRAYPIVRCGSCGCCAEGKDWTEPDTAIEAWNRRVHPAQAGAEPVLFIHPDTFARAAAHVGAWKPGHELPGYIPLYTHPPAPRVALSDARWQYINDRAVQMSTSKYEALCSLLHIEVDGVTFDLGAAVDEAIEAAHGITGETK